ncbi:alkaline phosphatase family protein [Leifsonia sp. AG29]|uniref:alkaline phosphatase family protein n=1 Tax=Leifsonia sp. AG29 TaxID=2598860 RepID=UPI00131DDBAD|nr:alkaline phosphatase family protein [Leifsonia sp. AG29]
MHGKTPRPRPRFSIGQRIFAVTAGCALAVVGGGIATASTLSFDANQVGSQYADGEQISSDQIIKPLGDRLMTPFGKLMGSVVSPDGRFVVGTSADRSVDLQVFDLKTYRPVAAAGTLAAASFATAASNAGFAGMAYQKISDGTVGQEGPVFSPDGKFLFAPVATGIVRYPFNADGSLGTGTKIDIPTTSAGLQALTAGMTFSPDGSTLYAAVNGQNTVVAIDPAAGTITHTYAVGIAPRQVKFVGARLYVSNEGGRQAVAGDTTMGSYGTQVPADTTLGTTTTGTVSVIDPANANAPVASIDVQLHPTAEFVDGNTLYVANTNSDTVSVIDTASGAVVQTIATQPWASSKTGYQPTGITKQGDHLLVSLGNANAIAVYKVDTKDPRDPAALIGLLPTDYYPENVAAVNGSIVVTNTRGIDARGPGVTVNKGAGVPVVTGHGTHSTTASLTRFTLPSDQEIRKATAQVFAQNGWTETSLKQAEGDRSDSASVAIPKRLGDPSAIKHVFLVIKENRGYDQLYGDMKQGNGDPSLTQFGQTVTPNQHALATQFGLYDNTYDIGTNSAEGHNWLMQGDNTAYTQTSAGEYVRSYDTEEDVLGHQRSGFLWNSVQSAGKSAKNFGEFEYGEGKPAGATWQQYYCAATSAMAGGSPAQLFDPSIKWNSSSVIPSLNAISDPNAAPFDLAVPDIYRYETWKQDFEKNGPSNFNMVWLSSDHTGGTADPKAMVADNDLALGKIVDEISHSQYWKDSAIFVAEDDSQDSADHVDGHRAPIQVISPYAVHGKTVSTYYSQISMVRTIEQILGAQPLNQKIAAATPMVDAFTNKPDLTPYTSVANQVPLTEGVTTKPACGYDTLGKTGAAADAVNAQAAKDAEVPASAQPVAAQWEKWAGKQHFTGTAGHPAIPDYDNPLLMNRYTWYQTKHWTSPYPGDAKIYGPDEAPGIAPGSTDHDDADGH